MDIDRLFLIAENCEPGGLFDQITAAISQGNPLGQRLLKFQQDVGQAINLEFSPDDIPPPGTHAETIAKAYEEVTEDRLGIFNELYNAIPEGTIKDMLRETMSNLGLLTPPQHERPEP